MPTESPVVVAPPPTKPAPAATATKPAPTKPAPAAPTWTDEDGAALGKLLAKRDEYLGTPRRRLTIGELRTRIGNMPADGEVMYEDWSDGGGVYATEMYVGGKLLVLK